MFVSRSCIFSTAGSEKVKNKIALGKIFNQPVMLKHLCQFQMFNWQKNWLA